MKFKILVLVLISGTLLISSCSDETVQPEPAILLFQQPGLVDSCVVYGCYPRTERFFSDTLKLESCNKLKITFQGAANSDGCSISVLYNTSGVQNEVVYYVEDAVQINTMHTAEFPKPADTAVVELRLYINPPVCGTNEFKYTSARDLKIYGLK